MVAFGESEADIVSKPYEPRIRGIKAYDLKDGCIFLSWKV